PRPPPQPSFPTRRSSDLYAALRDARPTDLPEVLDSRLIQDLVAKYAELTRQQAELSQKFKPDWPAMVRLRREIEETEERLETERDRKSTRLNSSHVSISY